MKEKTKKYLKELLLVVLIAVMIFSILQCTASMKLIALEAAKRKKYALTDADGI